MRNLERALILAIGVLLAPGVFITVSDLVPIPPQIDFAAYYLAAHAIRGGEDPYDPAVLARLSASHGVPAHTPYIYPPFLAVAIQPLASLSYPVAAAIWLALSAAALVAALVLLRSIVDIPDRLFPFAVGAVFVLPAVQYTLELGQINHFILLLVVAAAVQTSPRWSGILIGTAAALKVFPAVFGAVFLRRKHFGAAAAAVLVAVLATLASAAYTSGTVGGWIRNVAPGINGARMVTPNNQSLEAVSARFFAPHTFEAIAVSPSVPTTINLPPVVHAPGYASIIASAAGLLVIVLTARALVFTRAVPGAMAHYARFALVTTAVLIVLPVVWDHYYVLLLLPAAVLYRSRDRRLRVALLTATALILLHRYWRLTMYARSPVLLSAGLAGVFTLWGALLVDLTKTKSLVWASGPEADIIEVSSKGV
jgi:alpha-1,2-mannosyltransferase